MIQGGRCQREDSHKTVMRQFALAEGGQGAVRIAAMAVERRNFT